MRKNIFQNRLSLQTVFDMNSTQYEFYDYLQIIIGFIDDGTLSIVNV